MSSIRAIVCVNNIWGIGYKGKLLTHLKSDMEFFKEITTDNVVIYGNNTLKSFSGYKPLPKRINIVITHYIKNIPQESIDAADYVAYYDGSEFVIIKDRESYMNDYNTGRDLYIVNSPERALKLAYKIHGDKDIYICGGSSIYNALIDYCDGAYITKTDYETQRIDSYFPNLDEKEDWYISPKLINAGTDLTGVSYTIELYKNIKVKKLLLN